MPMAKKKTSTPKQNLPPEKLRTSVISIKVTADQKERIRKNAELANMSVSTYLLARGLKYQPKARLSDDECRLQQPLSDLWLISATTLIS